LVIGSALRAPILVIRSVLITKIPVRFKHFFDEWVAVPPGKWRVSNARSSRPFPVSIHKHDP